MRPWLLQSRIGLKCNTSTCLNPGHPVGRLVWHMLLAQLLQWRPPRPPRWLEWFAGPKPKSLWRPVCSVWAVAAGRSTTDATRRADGGDTARDQAEGDARSARSRPAKLRLPDFGTWSLRTAHQSSSGTFSRTLPMGCANLQDSWIDGACFDCICQKSLPGRDESTSFSFELRCHCMIGRDTRPSG